MDIQLKQFDLTQIEPKFNFIIIGHNGCGKLALNRHILYILRMKKSVVKQSNFSIKSVELLHEYTNNSEKFHVAVYNTNEGPSEIISSDILFVHSRYAHKEFAIKHYYKYLHNTNNYDFLKKYEAPNTFFVIQNGIVQIYKPEYDVTYLEMYNEKPFCRDNVTKLITNISNRFSMYHNKTSDLYQNLQIRLRELDAIHYMLLCMNNSENMWLPNDLKIVIVKLFFLTDM